MHISFVDRGGLLDEQLRQLGQRRLLFALSRFGARVESVKIQLDDLDGPPGGMNKACRITVRLRRMPHVAVTIEDPTSAGAITAAADRVGHHGDRDRLQDNPATA